MSDQEKIAEANELANVLSTDSEGDSVNTDDAEADVYPNLFPSEVEILEWKSKHPHANFRGLSFPGLYVVYKSFTSKEYQEVQKQRITKETELKRQLTDAEVELIILSASVFWPLDFSARLEEGSLPAAVPTVTSQYVMVASGFVDVSPEIL